MKKFGIDISRWQGDFDLEKAVKNEGVEFVIIKGGGGDDGLYVDRQFVSNYNKAKKLGIPVGCYWFSKALTLAEADKEAYSQLYTDTNGSWANINSNYSSIFQKIAAEISSEVVGDGYWIYLQGPVPVPVRLDAVPAEGR